jgi:hypothetical protein
MTLQEILKSQGLTDEQIEKVVGEMKQNKIFTTGLENADIRYDDLKKKFDSKTEEHTAATKLIEDLKKNNAGNEALQTKVTEYETTIATLNEQLKQTQLDAAIKIALMQEKAVDVDYLAFKIKEQGEELKLDDNGKIKGIDNIISDLKTQHPSQFSKETQTRIEEKKLPSGNEGNEGMTRQELLKKPYNERLKFYQENPEQFNEIMNS